jgi:hypothetical protein
MAGIRERIYQRALPLATRSLELRASHLGELAGVTGLALATADRLLASPALEPLVAGAPGTSATRSAHV